MSDPTYNRKQGVQKYWALFQREHRKRQERKLTTNACQVPAFDNEMPLYKQLQDYIQSPKSRDGIYNYAPACALYAEMFEFVKALFLSSDVVCEEILKSFKIAGMPIEKAREYYKYREEKKVDEKFKLADTDIILSIVTSYKNIKYMDKVRLRNLFPTQLDERIFEQWGLSDHFPKPDLSSLKALPSSQWRDCEVFKKHYDDILTVLEYVDTACNRECAIVETATMAQSAAFKNYFSMKRKYNVIMKKIQDAVEYRTADGSEEFKSIENWAKEFGFGIDASFELLYVVRSTDKENFDDTCYFGKDCLSRESVVIEQATAINPRRVSLTELSRFVGTDLRSSIEGNAARSLAVAEETTKAHKALAGLTMAAFSECREEFVSFINAWKTNFCSSADDLEDPADIFGDAGLGDFVQVTKVRAKRRETNAKLRHIQKQLDSDLAKETRDKQKIDIEDLEESVTPLRRVWTAYRKKLLEVEREERIRQDDEREEARQQRLASLIVDNMVDRRDELAPPPPPSPPPSYGYFTNDRHHSSSDEDDDSSSDEDDDSDEDSVVSRGTVGSLGLSGLKINASRDGARFRRRLPTLDEEQAKSRWASPREKTPSASLPIVRPPPPRGPPINRLPPKRFVRGSGTPASKSMGEEYSNPNLVVSDDEDALSDHGF